MKKENEFSCLFGHNIIISNGLLRAIRNKSQLIPLKGSFHKQKDENVLKEFYLIKIFQKIKPWVLLINYYFELM